MSCSRGVALKRESPRDWFDVAAALLFSLLAVLVVLTVRKYSISNDEGVQQRYGELIVAYYASGFTDLTLFGFGNLYLYGGLFDIAATLLAKVVALDLYELRHLLCAATGIGGIAATWATARLIAGSRAGLLAAALLAVSGPWYGTMFNHTKDIPFAAATIGAILFLLRAARDLPRPRPRDLALFGALLGMALGLRALGLLILTFVPLAVAVEARSRGIQGARPSLIFAARCALAFAPALLLAYMIMIAAWPWAALAPLNPVRGIFAFTYFHYPIRTLLAGQVYQMADVPRWYVPLYLLVRLPLMTICCAALALALVAVPRLATTSQPSSPPRLRVETCFVAFTAIFPVLCHVIDHGPAFTGLRHFLFVVPSLTVLAAIGADALLRRAACWRLAAARTAAAAMTAALAWNAILLARLHPYEYLFYNPLVGGLAGAAGRYVTDYWVGIMPEALDRLESRLAGEQRKIGVRRPYYVAVCAERSQFENESHGALRWTDDWSRADFFIAPTHMNCDHALAGPTIVKIERLGTLIGVVKDRRAFTRTGLARND